MGRRKKEPEGVHREAIAAAAERLFSQKGPAATTMDDIAREAGYSKATLYVYFANKEELVGYLIFKSMRLLCGCLSETVSAKLPVKEKYIGICTALTNYQEQYPLYFTLALGEINVDFEKGEHQPIEEEIYAIGEQLNSEIERFLREGIDASKLRPDIPILETSFLFWASLSGLIQTAANKQAYIQKTMHLTKIQFLHNGFERLYELIQIK